MIDLQGSFECQFDPNGLEHFLDTNMNVLFSEAMLTHSEMSMENVIY